jgi:hypothetical protein
MGISNRKLTLLLHSHGTRGSMPPRRSAGGGGGAGRERKQTMRRAGTPKPVAAPPPVEDPRPPAARAAAEAALARQARFEAAAAAAAKEREAAEAAQRAAEEQAAAERAAAARLRAEHQAVELAKAKAAADAKAARKRKVEHLQPDERVQPARRDDDDVVGGVMSSAPPTLDSRISSAADSTSGTSAAPSNHREDEGAISAASPNHEVEDDEVAFLGVGRTAMTLPHARYDCLEFPLAGDQRVDARRHCTHCWCGVCERPVSECDAWSAHCRTLPAQAEARRAAAREAAVRVRLSALPPRPPSAAGMPQADAELLADPRWGSLRYTCLSYISHCGRDVEGLMATLCAVHDVAPPIAARVMAVLEATGDLVTLDGQYHVRPGTSLQLATAHPQATAPITAPGTAEQNSAAR